MKKSRYTHLVIKINRKNANSVMSYNYDKHELKLYVKP